MVVERKRILSPNAEAKQVDLKALAQMQFLASIIASRAQLAGRLGRSFGGKRDTYEALGYPVVINYEDYRAKYARHEVANRVIEAPVDGSWELKPEIVEDVETETQFEKDIQNIIKEKKLFHFLRRLDILSCIGQYAVLLLGVDDGLELDQPLVKAKALLYIQPYGQDCAEVTEWNKNSNDERFGQPERYRLKVVEPGNVATYQNKDVHWSRVIHVAYGLLESNVYGTPELEKVYNRLLSLELIVGGSGEMFWQGAFPGLQFNAQPEMDMAQSSTEMKEEIDKYIHGLKRVLTTQGLDINKLASDVADPKSHVDVQIAMISIATGIPKRILEGSERGELASSQDTGAWNKRLDSRRKDDVEPIILRPFIDRLIAIGVLAPPAKGEYTVIWPDLNSPTNKEKADTGKVRTEAIEKYLNSGMDMLVGPRQYFEEILGMSVDEGDRILAGTEDTFEDLKREERESAEQNQDELNV